MNKIYVPLLMMAFVVSGINAGKNVQDHDASEPRDVVAQGLVTAFLATSSAFCFTSAALAITYPINDIHAFCKNPSRQEKQFVTLLKLGRSAVCLPLSFKLAYAGIVMGQATILAATYKSVDKKETTQDTKKA